MEDFHSVLFCKSGIHEAFYNRLISSSSLQDKVKIVSFQYNAGAPHYIVNLIKTRYPNLLEKSPDADCKIFFTYDDIDSFYNVLDKNYWMGLQEDLPNRYVSIVEIVRIVSSGSIEDWLLDDYAGILSFLNLPQNLDRPTGSAFHAMGALYRAANAVYIPANLHSMQRLINSLDIDAIVSRRKAELRGLIT